MAVDEGKWYAGQGKDDGDGRVFVLDAGDEVKSTSASWSAGSWYHAAVTKSGSNLTLFVDGAAQGSVTVNTIIETNTLELLIGSRDGRVQSTVRRTISAVSRLVVRSLFGSGVRDVNAPYRLMKGPLLRDWVLRIPPDTFAPNLLLSGLASRQGVRILELPVPHRERQTGEVSIRRGKLLAAAVRASLQILRFRLSVR